MTKPYSPNILTLNPFAFFLKFVLKFSLLTIFLFTVTPAVLQAQQKRPYNILWRIEGKGLSKPSYLFGTMHVKDIRAFRFSDSVMLAIQSCQAFSLEVHPDTIIKRMFTTLSDRDSSRSLKKLLSDADYQRLSKRFEKKNGYPMGNLDPIRVESMLKPEKKKPTDKKSFVDAYLFGIARSMGKNTYGLENANQQFEDHYGEKSDIKERLEGLMEDTYDEEALNRQEEMIKIYSAGNLDGIVNYLGKDELEAEDIVPRNNVMLNSMIRIMPDQSLFAAVGVAHLPGDNGLITLLRKAGYTVEAVKADFTGIADKYNTDYKKLPWKTYTDEESGYTLELPFLPMKTSILYGMPTIIYPNIANDIFFGAYAVQKGTSSKPVTEDEVMRNALKNFTSSKHNKIISKKSFAANGLKGTDITMDKDAEFIRFRLIVSNNFLYCLYAGNDQQSVNSAYANRFFNSFKTFKIAPRPNPTWITVKNDTAAFTAHFPGKPHVIVKDIPMANINSPEPLRLKIYVAVDSANLQSYLIRYSDYPIKNYLADKEKTFDAITEELSSRGKVQGKARKVFKDGYEGRELDFIIGEEFKCTLQLFARGNRVYILMRQNANSNGAAPPADDFFSSFKFIPYQKPKLVPLNVDSSAYNFMVFENNITMPDTEKNDKTYFQNISNTVSKNAASGGAYIIQHASISKYYRTQSLDSLYNTLSKSLNGYADSIVTVDTLVANGIKGRQVIAENRTTHTKKRSAVFIDNGQVFYITGHVASEELFDETNNALYTSLVKTRQTPFVDLTSSKAKLILHDLASTDTTTYNAALGALSYYDFEKADLPDMYKALNHTYGDDSLRTGTRAMLVKAFAKVNDDKTIDLLTSLFKRQDSNDELKSTIISTIPDVNKTKGYPVYLDLLTNSPEIKSKNSYQTFAPLSDSLEYAVVNIKRILPLLKYPAYRKRILSITQQMMYDEKKGKYDGLLADNFNAISQYAMADLIEYQQHTDTSKYNWFANGYAYTQLMQHVKGQPLTATFTNKLMADNKGKNQWVSAVITRIYNNLPVNQPFLNSLLDSLSSRYSLMEALNKQKQLARVPLKYKAQPEFARLCLYESLSADEDTGVSDVKLLGMITDKGQNYYALKYTTEYDEDHIGYIGIAGPFKPGSTKLVFDNGMNTYYDSTVRKTKWQQQAKAMIPKLIEQNQQLKSSKKD